MKKCARSKPRAGSGGVASSPSRPPNGMSRSATRLARRSDRPTGQRIRRVSKPGQLRNDWRLAHRVCRSIHRHRNGFPVFYKIARLPTGCHTPKVAVPGEFELRPVALDRSRHENSPAPLGHDQKVTAHIVLVEVGSTNSPWWSDPLLQITPPHPERDRHEDDDPRRDQHRSGHRNHQPEEGDPYRHGQKANAHLVTDRTLGDE